MGIKKSCFVDEFWGQKKRICDVTFEEDYAGQVADIIKEKIENGELDSFPEELEIEVVECLDPECEKWKEHYVTINPIEYLTDEEYEEIKEMLKEFEE